jgi:hypothetical protein
LREKIACKSDLDSQTNFLQQFEQQMLKGRVGRDVLDGARCVRAGKGRERKVG